MITVSPALVLIALLETSWTALADKALASASDTAVPTLLESHMVVRSRLGDDGDRALAAVVEPLRIEVIAFGHERLREACVAFDRYGKSRHAAALNFGDCISYALAPSERTTRVFRWERLSVDGHLLHLDRATRKDNTHA